MASTPISQADVSLAYDTQRLGNLKVLAKDDPKVAARKAASEFEALFLQMALKSMREATPSSSMFDSEQTRMYQSLLDQQLALNASQSRGTGLSEVIFRQLGGHVFDHILRRALQPAEQIAEPRAFFMINAVLTRMKRRRCPRSIM